MVLNHGFDSCDGVRRFDLEGKDFSSQGLDKDLHRSVSISLLALVFDVLNRRYDLEGDGFPSGGLDGDLHRGNSLLFLDFDLNILIGVRRFDLDSDGFP